MSKNNPIPTRLREKFKDHMAEHDMDDLPDGAWFAVLEEAAGCFMRKHGLTFPWQCPNTATHQYLRMKEAA